jgi:hypothetical protein
LKRPTRNAVTTLIFHQSPYFPIAIGFFGLATGLLGIRHGHVGQLAQRATS